MSPVDAYIAKALPFAIPILEHIRAQLRLGCPEAEETIKWGFPHFVYKGKNMCSMAAFKAHASFGFWHGELVTGRKSPEGMGSFGKIASLSDLPDDGVLLTYIRKARELIDQGVKPPRTALEERPAKPEILMPAEFGAALETNEAAKISFDQLAPSHRREYLEWISGAKRDETKQRRVVQAIEMLCEGKNMNWKYEQK